MDCAKHNAKYKRTCGLEGCEEPVFTSYAKAQEGRLQHGDSFKPFTYCSPEHRTAARETHQHAETTSHVNKIEVRCAVDECTTMVETTETFVAQLEEKGQILTCESCRKDVESYACDICQDGEVRITPSHAQILINQDKQLACKECLEPRRTCRLPSCGKGFLSKREEASAKAYASEKGYDWKPSSYCCKAHKQEHNADCERQDRLTHGGTRKYPGGSGGR